MAREREEAFNREKPRSWKEIPPVTNRGFDEYARHLNLGEEDLKGKRILDIGAGTRRFAREVEEGGIQAEVFSLEPQFSLPEEKMNPKVQEFIEKHSASTEVKEKTVAGVGEKIPFAKESFDLCISEYSLPMHSPTQEQVKSFFEEISRITKVEGEIRLYPINRNQEGKTEQGRTCNQNGLDEFINEQIDKLVHSGKFDLIKSSTLIILKKLKN